LRGDRHLPAGAAGDERGGRGLGRGEGVNLGHDSRGLARWRELPAAARAMGNEHWE
jgi:hypothetical protein